MAQWQPYVFSGGVLMLTLAMLLAGRLGVPRRVADLELRRRAGRRRPVRHRSLPGDDGLLVSVGAVLAVIGGIMFVWVMVMTLLRGEKTERPDEGLLYAFGTPERERVAAPRSLAVRPSGCRLPRRPRSHSSRRGAGSSA
jgi:heme/copper-type cytochrome/quinol oxidase subunit 1